MDKTKGTLLVILSALCFAFMPIFGKMAYAYGANSFTVLSYRFICASILLFIYLRVKKISMKISLTQVGYILCLSLVGYVMCSLTYFMSFNYINVGLSAMLLFTHPALVVVLSYFIYKEEMYIEKIISVVLTLIGIYLLGDIGGGNINLKGVGLGVIASIAYSIYILGVNGKPLKELNSFVVTFYICSFSAIFITIWGGLTNKMIWVQNYKSMTFIVLLALISTVVAMLSYVQGIKLIGPSKAAIFSTVEPVLAFIMGVILFKEGITLRLIIGCCLIVSSMLLIVKQEKKQKKKMILEYE